MKSYFTGFQSLLICSVVIFALSSLAYGYEGIETYYIRYDVKTSKNRIVSDNLLMVPSKNEFRAANFSQVSTTGVISATLQNPQYTIDQKIRDTSLKKILVDKGLRSVNSKDTDTVVSYEGIIITPLNVLKKTYDEKQNTYFYEAQIEFSPIAFPGQWETLHMKHKIKRYLNDVFELFK